MEQQKNVAYLRPVIAWSPTEEFTVSAAMEANVVNNAYGYTDSKGNFVDQSDRTGYGMSMTWNGLKTDPENGIVVNLNTAYLDANNEKDFTAGINALWKRFELGYIYAHNKIDEFSGVVCDNDCWIDDEGTYNIHTIHASYQFANVMDMENFNIYLGTYYSILDIFRHRNSLRQVKHFLQFATDWAVIRISGHNVGHIFPPTLANICTGNRIPPFFRFNLYRGK